MLSLGWLYVNQAVNQSFVPPDETPSNVFFFFFFLAVQILGLVTIWWDPECCVQCASQPLQTTTRRRS